MKELVGGNEQPYTISMLKKIAKEEFDRSTATMLEIYKDSPDTYAMLKNIADGAYERKMKEMDEKLDHGDDEDWKDYPFSEKLSHE